MSPKYRSGSLTIACLVALAGCVADDAHEAQNPPGHTEADFGQVSLAFRLPNGADINSVSWTLLQAGVTVVNGTSPVADDGTTTLTIQARAGTGYTLVMSGQTSGANAGSCAGASEPFTISAGNTVRVSINLQCTDPAAALVGSVDVTGRFNFCPTRPVSTVSPTSVRVGTPVTLTASSSDRDGDSLTYSWTAASGTFANGARANTTFTCASVGSVALTITADDGHGCRQTSTASVDCTTAGIGSSQSSYVVPVATGVQTRAILTVGDSPNNKPDGTPYRMVGIPDGLGLFDNRDGTFTLLSNQELGSTSGIARAHGGTGAFVSRWVIRKDNLNVLQGADLIQNVQLWNTGSASYVAPATPVSFNRFCSADLAPISAYFNERTGLGYDGRIFMDGEEAGAEGRAFAHTITGTSYELPRLGKLSFENSVAHPNAGDSTVVVGTDDSTPGQVYVYVGQKTNTGTPVDRAGLNNGKLFGIRVPGFPVEVVGSGIPTSAFDAADLGNVSALTGAQLQTASTAAGVTEFQRPEDGAWDPVHSNDFYFVTTASFTTASRLWRLRFTDVTNPALGGEITMVLDGSEGQRMLDNLTVDPRGHVLLQEDVGNNGHIGRIFRYTIATDDLTVIAQHDPNRFVTGAPGFLTQDEESSGIIDATDVLGAGWFLYSVQAHYGISGELVEGGQFGALYDPGTL